MRFFGKKVPFSRSEIVCSAPGNLSFPGAEPLPSPEPGSFFLIGEGVSGAKEILPGVISFFYAGEMEMIKRSSL